MSTSNRIELVDALRGFALIGIMLVHATEHFDIFGNAPLSPDIFKTADPFVGKLVNLLFAGKAYTIFSLMFGFSFFIQMDRAQERGVDFRLRFAWRLLILLCFGYMLSLVYSSQILVIYALTGLPLIFLYRLNKTVLVVVATLLLLQIPTIVNLAHSYADPDFRLQAAFGSKLYGEAYDTFTAGSFNDAIKFNIWKGHITLWSYFFSAGRHLQLFGLFLIGIVLGKSRFFENYRQYRKSVPLILFLSLFLFVTLYMLLSKLPDLGIPRPRHRLYYNMIRAYSDLALTLAYISGIILIFQRIRQPGRPSLLSYYGRMSLTNYSLQPLISVPLFYGYGLGLYEYFGGTLSLIYGLLFIAIQILISRLWLKHFHYGPLEWTWRALTFANFKLKFKISRDSNGESNR
ncbi:MAG: DUF418 domain-containing protein [Bacteroidales bacterium]